MQYQTNQDVRSGLKFIGENDSPKSSPSNSATNFDELQESCKAARRFINYRLRSEAEVRLRLSKRFGISVVRETLAQMYREGLLNDERFARMFTESRKNSRPKSASTVRRELEMKGVSRDLSLSVTSDIDDLEAALYAASKKSRALSNLPENKFHQKLIGHLRRRGFTYSISKNAANQAWTALWLIDPNPPENPSIS
ncbi:MAG: regulatory protein RecX [SAR202 cluster bacterium]|nr:regulatory protein RecX [SAR202 cluster bacterium]